MVVPSTMSRKTGKGTTRTAIKVLLPSHMEKVPNSIIIPLSEWIKTSVSTARRLGTSRKIAPEWLKSIMAKKGIDIVSFLNESMYS
jgi:hypothetical protein